ncbi:MAG: NfeD family protein [Bacteroidales bacterium]
MRLNTLFLFLFFFLSVVARDSQKKIFYKIDLKKEVGSTTWIYVEKGLKEAERLQATAIILDMNTYGGTVVHADSIRSAILNNEIPVFAFINNNAASAGALIAIACDSIYMRKGANIGAATVVNQTGEQMPDKYQSYMRATIRSTAEAQGRDTIYVGGKQDVRWRRDPHIAEAMVDDRVVIPHVTDSGKVLTLTTEEAIRLNYCEGIADNVDDLIRNRLKVSDYEIVRFNPSWQDEVLGWLTSPSLQAILIMIIVLGIYYELQSPGLGFPSVAAFIAACLYFAPLYLEGLAANWEILVFIGGIILLLLEFFVIPGFGIAGITGIILITGALILAMIDNVHFDFEAVQIPDANKAVLTVVAGIVLGFVGIIVLMSRIGHRGHLHKFALNTEETTEKGFIAVDRSLKGLIGKTGKAEMMLRPSGKILIDDRYYDAVSLYGYIDSGEEVVVIKQENAQLYVVSIHNNIK